MVIRTSALERSLHNKNGLMEKLGDAGRFLRSLLRGKEEMSEVEIKRSISGLETYFHTCANQIDEIDEEKQKTHRVLKKLHGELHENRDTSSRGGLLTKIDMYLAKYKGYDSTFRRIGDNGKKAQALIEKLRDLLYLAVGPMSEDAIDLWTAELDLVIDERERVEEAFQELETTSERASVSVDSRPIVDEIADLSAPPLDDEAEAAREQAIRTELAEMFES